MTSPSFQLAARRLRVLLRGVFHFKLATLLSVSKRLRGLARAFARIPIRPAPGTEAAALGAASQSHRQGAQHALLRQIRDVQPSPDQDVALAERVDVATVSGVEPLVDLHVHLEIHVFQATVASTVDPSINGALDRKHPIGLTKLELNADRVREGQPLKRFEAYLVLDHHKLPAAREKPADINLVRTIHKRNDAAARGPAS